MVQFKIDCNEYYSRILALGPKGHCTSCFKTVMCISCRRHVDVHKWSHVDRGRGQKPDFLVDVISG